ncbi:MAG: hypothetical protein AAFX06_30900, partial [Planctomycetota bacterium]
EPIIDYVADYTEHEFNNDDDAFIGFSDGDATTRFQNGVQVDFEAGTWTESNMLLVDQSLRVLHHKLGTTELLKPATGGANFLRMHGKRIDVDANTPAVIGWNIPGPTIGLTQNVFDLGTEWLAQTIFHEFAHNWDTIAENSTVDQFMALSGWTQTPQPDDTHNEGTSTGEAWWYRNTATFARDYGKLNPREDFATAFAAYFMNETGQEYQGGNGAADIPDKIAYLDGFFADFA